MFQSAHNNSVHAILRSFQGVVLSDVLIVEEAAEDDVVEGTLILQPLDVLGGVGVDALERANELIVKSLNVRDDAAGNLDVLLTSLQSRGLLVIIPLLGVLNDNVVTVLLEDLEEAREFLLGSLPVLKRHGSSTTRAKVESGRDKSKEEADLLVRGVGDLVQLLHDLDLLSTIGVLLSSGLHDGSKVLEDALGSVLECAATLADSSKTLIVSLLGRSSLNLERDLLGLDGSSHNLLLG